MKSLLVITVLSFFLLINSGLAADESFVPPTLPNGQTYGCPGDSLNYTCTAVGGALTEWTGTAFDCTSSFDTITLNHNRFNTGTAGGECNDGAITGRGVSVNGSCYTSELTVVASLDLNGTTVMCSPYSTNPNVTIGMDTLMIAGIPTPTLMTSQVSLTTVTVNLTVDNSQCVEMYFLEITGGGSTISRNSSSSTFSVPGLDLCTYNYTAVGFTQAPSGSQGMRSSTYNMLPVDLSSLQGITNVSSTPSILEWDQLPNSQSQCITHYTLSWPDGGEYNTPDTTTSVSAMDLNMAGFPYCQTLSVTVTPQTPVGPVTEGSGSTDIVLEYQGLQGVDNVRSTPSILEWDQLPNSQTQCITHYTLSWPDGGQYNTPDTTTSVSAMDLNMAGFPYCQTLSVTVTPQTPVGPLSGGTGSTDLTLQLTGFTDPMLTHGFTLQDGIVQLRVMLQAVSEDIVPNRMYGYSRGAMSCTPNVTFTGSLLTISLPGAKAGDSVTACVIFQNMDCVAINTSTSNVPDTSAPTVSGGQTAGTDYQVTITLPTTSFSPSDLLIIASLSPGNTEPIVNDFPPSSLTYTVTFTGLNPETSYTYSIRIVLRSDNNVNVVAPSTGCFTILTNLSQLSCGTAIALSVILTFLVTLVIGISIGVVSVLVYNKCKRGTDQSSSQPAELTSMSGPVYEEPVDFKPDPHTAGNVAYGHVQPLHSRQ